MATSLESDQEFAAALALRSNPAEAVRQDDETIAEPLSPGDLTEIIDELDNRPEKVVPFFQQVWEAQLSREEIASALYALRDAMILSRGSDAAEIVSELPKDLRTLLAPGRGVSDLSLGPTTLPTGWWLQRPSNLAIDIDPKIFQFEVDRDWTGWAWNAASGWIKANWLSRRANFRTGAFDYELNQANAVVSLFSDWGTGLYYSKYIAHFIAERTPHLAVHLGDVYYAGKEGEFSSRFEDVLDAYLFKTSPATRLLCLNANHEMYSRSVPYFAYLDNLKNNNRSFQEGSYFRIRLNNAFQIIGLDTASTIEGKIANGRLADPDMQQWLRTRLEEGRAENRINILLSSDYPYIIGSSEKSKLYMDLQDCIMRGLIDVWFWGDSHYCALFFRGPSTPFIGSCVGHGGFPYYKRDPRGSVGSLAAPRFVECRSRFHGTDVRSDMGNNGFAVLTCIDESREIVLEYVDWRNESRYRVALRDRPGIGFSFLD